MSHASINWIEPIGDGLDPINHRLTRKLCAPVRRHLFLPVEWNMVWVFAQCDIGKQLSGSVAVIDWALKAAATVRAVSGQFVTELWAIFASSSVV